MNSNIITIIVFLCFFGLCCSSNSTTYALEGRSLDSFSSLSPLSENEGKTIGWAFGIALKIIIGICLLACLIDPTRTTVLLIVLTGFSNLSHLRFINVSFSTMAEAILDGQGDLFLPNIFLYIFSKSFTTTTAVFQPQIDAHYMSQIGIFEVRGVSCLFLDNYGSVLFELLIYMIMTLLFLALKWLTKNISSIVQRIINSFLYFLKYNLILAVFLGNFDTLILSLVLQSYERFDSPYAKASVIIGSLCIPLTIIALVLLFWVSCKMYKIQKECMYLKKELPVHVEYAKKQYDVLLAGLRYQKKRQFFFVQIIMFQRLWFITVIFTLNAYPLAQTILVTGLTLMLILFTFLFRPFSKMLTTVVLIFNECCVLVFVFLSLALLANSNNQTIVNNTGYAILGLVLAIGSGNGIFACFLLGFAIRNRFYPQDPNRDLQLERRENKNLKRKQTQLDDTQKKLQDIATSLNLTNRSVSAGTNVNPYDNTIVEDDPGHNKMTAVSVINDSKDRNGYFNKALKEDFARGAKLPHPTIWRPGDDPMDKIENDIADIKLKLDSMLKLQSMQGADGIKSPTTKSPQTKSPVANSQQIKIPTAKSPQTKSPAANSPTNLQDLITRVAKIEQIKTHNRR